MKHSSNYYIGLFILLPTALSWTIRNQVLSYTGYAPQGLALAVLAVTYVVSQLSYVAFAILVILSSVRCFFGPQWQFSWSPLERFSLMIEKPKSLAGAVFRIVAVVALVLLALNCSPWMSWSHVK